jgi:hypothetical protein
MDMRLSLGRRWGAAVPLLPLLWCAACPGASTKGADPSAAAAPVGSDVAEPIYDGSLKGSWQETGSVTRDVNNGPAKIRFDSGEWTLMRPGLEGHFGALVFRAKEPANEGEFLEVRVGTPTDRPFPKVKINPDHYTTAVGADGWVSIRVPTSQLDPSDAPFDRVVFRTFRPLANEDIYLDNIALTQPAAPGAGGQVASNGAGAAGGRVVRSRVTCDAHPAKISPFIYGIAFGDEGWPRLGVATRRWGGNQNSRYNWEKHFNNTAMDWYFENQAMAPYTKFLTDSAAHGATNALTIPMIGWVAKDASSYSYPVSVFGAQKSVDPYKQDAGNGVDGSGKNIAPGPPTRTSVEAPPEWAKRWVQAIRDADAKSGKRSVGEYILDNEPMLWNTTQRDVHPEPMGYDELLDRSIRYGTAIREADPDAVIAGPAEWGWPAYFDSSKDTTAKSHSDREAHQGIALVEWYLKKLAEHEKATGTRILDVLDLHYYPQADNVYGGGAGGSDRDTQLRRLRSTRSLWDPNYTDESWIHQSVRLLPRMHEWVDTNYPGRGISIGEWNFGGEKDVSGALATAEALGRFAQFGVTSAYYWTAPGQGSPSAFGFIAYRNFDGKGGRFLDAFAPATAIEGGSLFVSRDEAGKHLVMVAINLQPDTALAAEVDVSSCGTVSAQQAYVYSDGAKAFAAAAAGSHDAGVVKQSLPPFSITVIDTKLQ